MAQRHFIIQISFFKRNILTSIHLKANSLLPSEMISNIFQSLLIIIMSKFNSVKFDYLVYNFHLTYLNEDCIKNKPDTLP